MYLRPKEGYGGLHRAVGAHVCFRAEMGYFRAVSKGLAGLKMVGLRKISYFRHNILIVWPYFREKNFFEFHPFRPQNGSGRDFGRFLRPDQ